MALAVERAQLGLGAQQLRLLGPQADDHRRGHHLADGVEALAAAAQRLHQAELGLALGQVGTGLDQLAVECRQLLVVEQRAVLRADQVVLGLVALDRLLGLAHLVAQGGQPLVEPDRGPVGGEQLGLELVVDIDLGEAVGDLRRLGRAQRGIADGDQVGAAVGGHLEPAGEQVDGHLAGEPGRLALQHRHRLLRQSRPPSASPAGSAPSACGTARSARS